MNKEQHLLCKLAEECAELGKDAIKASVFGMDDQWQDLPSNRDAIINEFNDICGVMEMIFDTYINDLISYSGIKDKKEKLERYMQYSRERGRLE